MIHLFLLFNVVISHYPKTYHFHLGAHKSSR